MISNSFDPRTYIPEEYDIPNYINLMIPIFLIALLSELFISTWRAVYYKKTSYHDFNNTIVSITMGAFQELFHYFLNPLFFIPYFYVWNNYRLVTFDTSSVLSFVLSFIGIDLCVYIFHRLGHETNFFWAIHVPHHSSDYFNFSAAIRQGVFQYIHVWIHYLPVAFIVHPVHYSFHHHWNRIFQFWLHCEMFPKMKFLECIFVTPSLHKVHHASNIEYLDKNYGGTLIIWDKIFGTFQEEHDHIDIKYGTTDGITSFNILWLNTHHFFYMYHLSKKLKGFSKLKVLWKSPSWHPDHDLPTESTPKIEENPTPINNKLKQNDVFNYMICMYLIVEISVLSSSMTTLEMFKHTFTDYDLTVMATILVTQILSTGVVLTKNCRPSNQQVYQNFFSKNPLLCIWQTIRICLSGYFFHEIIQNHIVYDQNEIVEYYTFMVYFTIVQLISWLVSIIYCYMFLKSIFLNLSFRVKVSLKLHSNSKKAIEVKDDQIAPPHQRHVYSKQFNEPLE